VRVIKLPGKSACPFHTTCITLNSKWHFIPLFLKEKMSVVFFFYRHGRFAVAANLIPIDRMTGKNKAAFKYRSIPQMEVAKCRIERKAGHCCKPGGATT
jgi:hypothetical protein